MQDVDGYRRDSSDAHVLFDESPRPKPLKRFVGIQLQAGVVGDSPRVLLELGEMRVRRVPIIGEPNVLPDAPLVARLVLTPNPILFASHEGFPDGKCALSGRRVRQG